MPLLAFRNVTIKADTPHLDRLYGECVRLTDFHVSPLCTPTRAGLMTGNNPVRVGAWGTTWGRSLPNKDFVTIADVFAGGGYRTGCFGKWHLGDNYPFRPQDRGFQEVLVHGGGGVGQTPDYWGNDYFDDTYFHNGKPRKLTGYCTDVWFDAALKFIEANKDRRFLAYVSTNAPHGPLNVDPKYSRPYLEKGVPEAMAKFYGMITNIDENMGRLLDRLEAWGLADNTMLIFLTDNGTANGAARSSRPGTRPASARPGPWQGFNAGMRGKKGSLYDGGHRVPLFIRWPEGRLVGGRDVDTLAAYTDLLPTLADLCNLELPPGASFDGVSLAPLLKGESTNWPHREIFVQYRQSAQAPQMWNATVMSERWRLVGGKQLFDIDADPGQSSDVASRHAEIVERLRKAYQAWWAEVSPRFDEYCEIIVGSDAENPARLTAFDWHTHTPWNQTSIRAAPAINGFWAVEVARDGDYEISLRRWPEELNHPIAAAIPGGKAIRATTARLKIGDADLSGPIPHGAAVVTFHLKLAAGKSTLQTWLVDEKSGQSRGAYYVIVRRK